METVCSPKRWYLPASPHVVTTQKTNINMFIAVRTSDLKCNEVKTVFKVIRLMMSARKPATQAQQSTSYFPFCVGTSLLLCAICYWELELYFILSRGKDYILPPNWKGYWNKGLWIQWKIYTPWQFSLAMRADSIQKHDRSLLHSSEVKVTARLEASYIKSRCRMTWCFPRWGGVGLKAAAGVSSASLSD
jgi:hypothetical protein